MRSWKDKLAASLKVSHKFENGCWFTEYSNIPNLSVHASSTNGTSGLGLYGRNKVYWYYDHNAEKFIIEDNNR